MIRMNAGIWIGIIGGIAGLLIGVGAVVATAGTLGLYIGAGMLLVFGGMFYLFYRLFFKPMILAARLQKTGLPGTAKIMEVKDTGVTVNNSPQVKLIIEVRNDLGQRYMTECRVLVPRLNPGAYRAGMEIRVKIDPKNEKIVVPDFTEQPSSSGITYNNSPAALTSEIEQLQKDNEAIILSGRPARAIIKKNTWLGVNVNGNNPYVELDLEVLPENSTSFSGKAKGVIGEQAVNKFQPGCEIIVKYDFYDNSKIAIDRSI